MAEEIKNSLLIVDLNSGAMDGMYPVDGVRQAERVADMLNERHPGSCWAVVKVMSTHGRLPGQIPVDSLWHTNRLGLGKHAAKV